MIKIKWHNKKVDEEDAQQVANADQNATAVDDATKAKLVQLNQQKATLLAQKRQKDTAHENDIRVIDNNLNIINKQIADLGGNVSDNESLKASFYKNLYESVLNKKDEMYAMVSMAFQSIPDLSYTPNNTRCMTYARGIDEVLSKMNDGSVTEETFKDIVRGILDRTQISFSNKEKDSFINKLWELIKENAVFKVKLSTEN